MARAGRPRSLSFYLLAAFFGLFVLFLYGPFTAIVLLSFQGPDGGLTFPMRGFSTHWFGEVFKAQRIGSFVIGFQQSIQVGVVVMLLTVVVGTMVGLAYRSRFRGATVLFYLTVASLIVPSVLVSLGIGVLFDRLGLATTWYASGVGAQLTWTLPFAMLIMLAVFNRFNPSYEEAARDLGAGDWSALREIVLPLIAPSLIGVALLGFTLSYDELVRSSLTMGGKNTLPMEIYGMTANVTSPALYALGTLTTLFSFVMIGLLVAVSMIASRRGQSLRSAGRSAVDDE